LPEHVAGIDEAGRGCLAGPVVAAAVILPPEHGLTGLADSKVLSAGAREQLAPRIRAVAVAWGLGVVWAPRIDSINILQATFEAMCQAVRVLRHAPDSLLIDGNMTLPHAMLARAWQKASQPCPTQRAVVDGDRTVNAISAASILAKTFRDKLMQGLSRRWPGYGFEKHKGYGTKAHYEALQRLGPCPQHRLTFRGVSNKTPEPPHICLGKTGEDSATALLHQSGMCILARNWRKGRLELDIVCRDKDTIVFVEVKTRRAFGLSTPADAITPAKRRMVARAAQAWLAANKAWHLPCRFDVVCVVHNGQTFCAEHYQNAFDFPPTLGGRNTAWQPW